MTRKEQERHALLTCSLERVLNNAIYIAQHAVNARKPELAERAYILLDDLEGNDGLIKYLAARIWNEERERQR